MTRIVLLVAAIATLLPGLASAQQPPAIAPNARIRVTSSSAPPMIGNLWSLDDTTLTIVVEGSQAFRRVPRASVSRIEVSVGRRTRGKNAAIGAAVGALVSAALAYGGHDQDNGWFSDTQAMLYGDVVLVPLGALFGLASSPGPERWTDATAVLHPSTATTSAGVPALAPARASEFAANTRLRVWTSASAAPRIGKVWSIDDSAVTLVADDGKSLMRVPREAVSRMDVSMGRGSRGKHAAIGALVGAAAAVVMGLGASSESGAGSHLGCQSGACIAMAGAITVPVGALVGAAIPGKERWREIRTTSHSRMHLAVAPGPAVRFSFRF